MAFSLEKIIPWGRSFEEYVRMFALTASDFTSRILSCGDGPADFNNETTKLGGRVISIDPLYQCTAQQIRTRIDDSFDQVMEQVIHNQENFVWNLIKSPAALGAARMAAMNSFLVDFEKSSHGGRYTAAELPLLPFKNKVFDLALCSHLLFLYTEQLSLAFHRDSIVEMCRVAQEIRIFPLFDLSGTKSRHLNSLVDELQQLDFTIVIEQVDYEFQRGANQMLKVRKN